MLISLPLRVVAIKSLERLRSFSARSDFRKAFARVEGFADRDIVTEDRQLIARLKNRVRPGGHRLFAALFDQHHQNARLRFQPRLRKGDAPVFLRDLIERYKRDGIRADIVQQHDRVERVRPPDDAVRHLLQHCVAPGANAGHAHENKDDGHDGQRDQDGDVKMLDLARLKRQEDVDESGYDRDVEHVSEQHRDPGQSASAAV